VCVASEGVAVLPVDVLSLRVVLLLELLQLLDRILVFAIVVTHYFDNIIISYFIEGNN
jgi:hypothetical protein